jgi:outer membrane protein assembly factor BamB
VVWKRALREKVVSTPASTGERVAIGTSRGNVYALSLETGRVLWKFATRAQVRGGIAHASGSFFVPSYDGRLYALADDTGRKRWSVALGRWVRRRRQTRRAWSSGTAQGSIVAHDTNRRAPVVVRDTLGQFCHPVATVASTRGGDELYCLDADDGSLVWSFRRRGETIRRRGSRRGDVVRQLRCAHGCGER